jgi:glyoxylase-like metal-dependent hydrolase (beta-lactamase superfamily II)
MQPIAESIHLIPGPRGGRFPFSNSILILDRVRVLIDTGCGRETLTGIQKEFSPDLVLLSHGHLDHCSGSAVFSPSQLWTPEESHETTGDLAAMARRFIAPHLRDEWMAYTREAVDFKDFRAENTFGGHDTFDLGALTLIPVHAPGHADDHYAFHIPEAGVMACTDIDFTAFGPWYANDESDIDRFIQSIRHVQSHAVNAAVSSHIGVIRDDIDARFARFLAVFDQREERLSALLDRPRSLDDLVDKAVIYGSFPIRPGLLRFWERQMVEKHLNRMMDRGEVIQEDGQFVRSSEKGVPSD